MKKIIYSQLLWLDIFSHVTSTSTLLNCLLWLSYCLVSTPIDFYIYRCQKYPDLNPRCVLVADPRDKCCAVPFCDFQHFPKPFPTGTPPPFIPVNAVTPAPWLMPTVAPVIRITTPPQEGMFWYYMFCHRQSYAVYSISLKLTTTLNYWIHSIHSIWNETSFN